MAGKWTLERRAAQAERARKNKPWLNSTGPRTPAGKRKVSQNNLTHGNCTKEAFEKLRLDAETRRQVLLEMNPNGVPEKLKRGRPRHQRFLDVLSPLDRTELSVFDAYANALTYGSEQNALAMAAFYAAAIGYAREGVYLTKHHEVRLIDARHTPRKEAAVDWLQFIHAHRSPKTNGLINSRRTSEQIAWLLLATVRHEMAAEHYHPGKRRAPEVSQSFGDHWTQEPGWAALNASEKKSLRQGLREMQQAEVFNRYWNTLKAFG